jgi:hypothetical protein
VTQAHAQAMHGGPDAGRKPQVGYRSTVVVAVVSATFAVAFTELCCSG